MRQRCPVCGRTQRRSTKQNARYWALLTLISERLKVDGTIYDASVWAEYMKRKFLGAQEFRLSNGEVLIVPQSSSQLDEDAFSDYLTKVEAWALERNVWLEDRE